MKILLTGTGGQLGQALLDSKPDAVELISTTRHELDLSDAEACRLAVQKYQPDWVVNAGAYTAVDQAESEPELAHAVNAGAPEAFAQELHRQGGRLLQLSTDFVFDGSKSVPYLPADNACPLSVYGSSKLAGEAALQLQLPDKHTIIRTSWLYSEYGKNFVETMLRLMKQEDELGVVADQVGSPTSTHSLVALLLTILGQGIKPGIYHWTDGASISWYEFAQAIQQEAIDQGLLRRKIPIKPLTTKEYSATAVRPSYSVLDRSETLSDIGIQATDWRQELRLVIKQIAKRTED